MIVALRHQSDIVLFSNVMGFEMLHQHCQCTLAGEHRADLLVVLSCPFLALGNVTLPSGIRLVVLLPLPAVSDMSELLQPDQEFRR